MKRYYMARAKKIDQPLIAKVTESLTVGNQKSYTVVQPFKGCFNDRVFNCKVGDVVLLSVDEFSTYKRFLGE